jgi:hypothetical protein
VQSIFLPRVIVPNVILISVILLLVILPSVILLRVILLNVILPCIFQLSVILLSVIPQNPMTPLQTCSKINYIFRKKFESNLD